MVRSRTLRLLLLVVGLIGWMAVPATAQDIPAGDDVWSTPNNGETRFIFDKDEVEALCGLPGSDAWDRTIKLHGVPFLNDVDTIVRRLNAAKFINNVASVKVQFARLHLASDLHSTPCGDLYFDAILASDRPQPTTPMTIRRTSDRGGVFFAKLALRVEIRAYQKDGTYLGSVFHDITLDDVAGGTAWSYGGPQTWRPGMTETNNCIDVLREKLLQYTDPNDPVAAQHFYFISNMIAAGQCRKG